MSEIFLEKKIDGLILTNTTVGGRELLVDENKNKQGGLSGYPLESCLKSNNKKFLYQF